MASRTDSVAAMRNLKSAIESLNRKSSETADFCNNENIEEAISTLSEEFEYFGISPTLNYEDSESSLKNILIDLINASWNLVNRHRGLMKTHENFKDAQHKVTHDNINLTNHVKRLKENLEKKEHALCEAQERERRLKVELEKLSRDLKREKEETIKLKKQSQSKDIQHAHELRRVQQSGQKLRQQLEKSAGTYVPKDKVFQNLQAENEKKIRLYEQTIQRLEENNGFMMQEISELRNTLALHVQGMEMQVEASGNWDQMI